jgi:hypothetical protein
MWKVAAGLFLILAIVPTLFFWTGSCGAAPGGECVSAPAPGWPAALTISAILLVAGIACITSGLIAATRRRRTARQRSL